MVAFADIVSVGRCWLKGISQIMLLENAFSGLLLLIGVFYGSPLMGLAMTLAVICGTSAATILKFNQSEIDKGLYGFSAALVGVGLLLFFEPTAVAWILVVICSIMASLLQHFFIRRNIPAFTFPFVLIMWIVIFIATRYFPFLLSSTTYSDSLNIDYLGFGIKSFGQVIFQDSMVAGMLFFIAVLIDSPMGALFGLAAAMLSGFISWLIFAPIGEVSMGLFGYNAVLCAIVFAGKNISDVVWAVISVLMALVIGWFMWNYRLVQLTFPFVLASCITVIVKGYMVTSHGKSSSM